MHYGETPALSQEQAAALLWLLQHLREWGVKHRRWLVPEPSPQASLTTCGQLLMVRRVRLLGFHQLVQVTWSAKWHLNRDPRPGQGRVGG